jgi:dTMP kinase
VTYIALEGIEGAGKSTVRTRLAAALEADGLDLVEVREPGGTATGEQIRNIVLNPDGDVSPWAEALLFAAARSQLAVDVIAPALAAGKTVVGDRSVYSSIAYQGGARGLGIPEVRAVNEAGLDGVWPDLVILLRLEAAYGLDRQERPDRIGAEGASFMELVVTAYDKLATEEPDRFEVIDAALDIAEVTSLAHAAVRSR